MARLAFDIGGTFTDIILSDDGGAEPKIWKVPSTAEAPGDAAISIVDQLIGSGEISASDISIILHATTVATNAILERNGARTALVTTRGFRDIALMGRQTRPNTHDMNLTKPRPLIERADIFEISERIDASGAIYQKISMSDVEKAIAHIQNEAFDAVAVVFLHSYINDTHEKQAGEMIQERLPGIPVSLSSEVSPKLREYERTTTTIANAYVQPIVASYISKLENILTNHSIQRSVHVMQSNGGLISTKLACQSPVRIIESGPAAGALMCAAVANELRIDHAITLDMGGTTAKMATIQYGKPSIVPSFEIETASLRKGSGLPLNITAVDLLEIGSGGGSIARIQGGLLTVGPESTGAKPGPMCFGNGGQVPTVTDANLILGYINADHFGNGTIALNKELAEQGINKHIATPLDLGIVEAAWGIHAMANANMERGMRMVSIERGKDPRSHTLIAFGGAGPLHAARIARQMRIPRCIIPRLAGIGSAIGLLTAQHKLDRSQTRVLVINAQAAAEISNLFAKLRKQLGIELNEIAKPDDTVHWQRSCSMRYAGQGYEITVPLPDDNIDEQFFRTLRSAFEKTYTARYGFSDQDMPIEGVDWHLMATLTNSDSNSLLSMPHQKELEESQQAYRQVYFPETDGFSEIPVFRRESLKPDIEFLGPAIVEDPETATVILPGDSLSITHGGHLEIIISNGTHK